jgi:hypothetical protein
LPACSFKVYARDLQALEMAAPRGDQAFFLRVKAGDFLDALPQLRQSAPVRAQFDDDRRRRTRRLAGEIDRASRRSGLGRGTSATAAAG